MADDIDAFDCITERVDIVQVTETDRYRSRDAGFIVMG
ncbi:hypothetical protein ABIA39_005194 [Nocardia sp. GAS34]